MRKRSRATPIHSTAARGFARGAEVYDRGRPDYPPQARAWLQNEVGLAPGKVVLDLGAGTGKFTRALLTTGASVIAVDPVAQMLEQLSRAAPEVESLRGDAEHIPLPDAAVDAVVCAQAFHWFATRPALAQIHRVLRPGGVLALIWNVRDASVDWVASLTSLLMPYEGDAPRYDRGEWRKVFPAPGFGPLLEQHFPYEHVGSPQHVILDRVASISFVAALEPELRGRLIDRVRRLIEATPSLAGAQEVAFPYVTSAFHSKRLAE